MKCFEDNVLVRRALSEDGSGKVLVVDGGGSLRAALVGDVIAGLALENGWSGILLNGAVRDVAALGDWASGSRRSGASPARAPRPARAKRRSPWGSATRGSCQGRGFIATGTASS